jgi:gamma-glutamyl-gamma-aminobutyrate hydrolase PuuD
MPTRKLFWAYNGETGLAECFSDLFDGMTIITPAVMDKLDAIRTDDVVLFDGGTDINPELYDEIPHPFTQKPDKVRDERERIIFRRAQAAGAG